MQSSLNPYLSFRDNAREAMELYQTVFGGKLEMHTFEEFNAAQDPADNDLIMHSMIEAENGISFMASDTPKSMENKPGNTISMSLSGDNQDELRAYYEKLAEGGTITMPLDKAIWGDFFGMCVDKFGVNWIVNISQKAE